MCVCEHVLLFLRGHGSDESCPGFYHVCCYIPLLPSAAFVPSLNPLLEDALLCLADVLLLIWLVL